MSGWRGQRAWLAEGEQTLRYASGYYARMEGTRKETTMKVRCKFRCGSVLDNGFNREVQFFAVTDDGTKENELYYNGTPNGQLKLTISNPTCFDAFKPNQQYYLDITPAEE